MRLGPIHYVAVVRVDANTLLESLADTISVESKSFDTRFRRELFDFHIVHVERSLTDAMARLEADGCVEEIKNGSRLTLAIRGEATFVSQHGDLLVCAALIVVLIVGLALFFDVTIQGWLVALAFSVTLATLILSVAYVCFRVTARLHFRNATSNLLHLCDRCLGFYGAHLVVQKA